MTTPDTDPDVVQNAGRCDICGQIISMADGDSLEIVEFPAVDEGDDTFSQEEVANAVASLLEGLAADDDGATRDLAATIREQAGFKAHEECLNETVYPRIEEAEEYFYD